MVVVGKDEAGAVVVEDLDMVEGAEEGAVMALVMGDIRDSNFPLIRTPAEAGPTVERRLGIVLATQLGEVMMSSTHMPCLHSQWCSQFRQDRPTMGSRR